MVDLQLLQLGSVSSFQPFLPGRFGFEPPALVVSAPLRLLPLLLGLPVRSILLEARDFGIGFRVCGGIGSPGLAHECFVSPTHFRQPVRHQPRPTPPGE